MKFLKILTTFLFVTTVAEASLVGLQKVYEQMLYTSRINALNSGYLSGSNKNCQQTLADISADSQISVFIGFGYMDVSLGQDFVDSGSIYQNGDTLDIDAAAAFAKALTSQCLSTNVNGAKIKTTACGFSKSGSKFTKTITNKFTGKNMKVVVQMASSSFSANDAQNKTTYSAKQQAKSDATSAQFVSALRTHDVVIYMGHARSGGGPDFYPPIMTSNGHVNYPHYKKTKPGFSKMVGALQKGSNNGILGVLACKSTGLFSGTLKKLLPNSILVTADNLFDYNDILPTGLNLVEAITSQSCGNNFEGVTKSYLNQDTLSIFF